MMPDLATHISLAFVIALTTALVTVPLLRRWALAQGRIDQPDARKVHTVPVPRLGGIGLCAAFWAGLLGIAAVAGFSPLLRALLAGGGLIFLTGVCDDLRGLTARQKFAGQIIASLVAVAVGGVWIGDCGDLFGTGRLLLPAWLGVPFTVFALVGVSNAINLIDGLDGLAGGLTVIALGAFALLALQAGDHAAVLACLALAGAVLGFLRYNLRPAYIFMGDAGSLTLGFVLGLLAVHLTQPPLAAARPMVPVLILAVPLVDTLRVMALRLQRGVSPFTADRGHIHHLLLDRGLGQRGAVASLCTLAAAAAALGVLGRDWADWQLLVALVGGVLLVACCWWRAAGGRGVEAMNRCGVRHSGPGGVEPGGRPRADALEEPGALLPPGPRFAHGDRLPAEPGC